MSSNARPDVSIVQLCLPHYRVPFFVELKKRLAGHLVVVTGPYSFGKSPVSMPSTPDLDRINVRQLFIRNQLVIQYRLPAIVFTGGIAVLDFNPRILSNFWILAQRKRVGRSVILWGHGLSPRPNSPKWIRPVRKWMAQHADALIFYSEQGKRDFINLGLPAEKLFVAYNAIDVSRVRQLATRFTSKRRHILYVGRLIAAKKVDLLLDGFAKALDCLPSQTKLILIGDGPEKRLLLAQAMEAGILPRVEFVGEITDDEQLAPYFAQSMLAVSPGYVGLAAVHSLAYGVPMLVADAEPHSPEVELLSQERNCRFFTASDSDALAQNLREMVSQPDKSSAMGQAGVEDVTAKYSLRHMADTFLRAFDYALPWINAQPR